MQVGVYCGGSTAPPSERNPAKSLLLELGSQDSETSSQANATASGTRDLMEVKFGELTVSKSKSWQKNSLDHMLAEALTCQGQKTGRVLKL